MHHVGQQPATSRHARLVGSGTVIALVLAAFGLPARALAADPPEVSGVAGSTGLIVLLLLGSITAGIFFASPLRRRLEDVPPSGRVAAIDDALDVLGERVVSRGRRFAARQPVRPLPIMLGGDIFFEDEPQPRPTSLPRAARSSLPPSGPWSTAPLSGDRYGAPT